MRDMLPTTESPRRPSTVRRRVTASLGAAAMAAAMVVGPGAFARSAPDDVAELAARVIPAVVNITVEHRAGPIARMSGRNMLPFPEGSPYEEFFKRFFEGTPPGFENHRRRGGPGLPGRPHGPHARGVGSGFIIDKDGYIVTNNHVIDDAETIRVTLSQDETYPAKVIGRDEKTDLALLKIDAGRPLPYVQFGDSDKVRVGDWIMAVGNPFGLGGSVTVGVVSARGRDIGGNSLVDFLQIDAPINPGNSGGPTFDADGKVIGVNTAIYSPNGGNVGIGFDVPSNVAKRVIAQLREKGHVSRGWLGVKIQPVTKEIADSFGLDKARGALVAEVVKNSPAAAAGLKAGDVVLAWNGTPVKTVKDLSRLVAASPIDEAASVSLWREGQNKTLKVTVAAMPSDRALAARMGGGSGDEPSRVPGLGLAVVDLTAEQRKQSDISESVHGVLVAEVDPQGPAASAGVRAGEVIESVALQPVKTVEDLLDEVETLRAAGKRAVALRLAGPRGERFVALRFAQA